MSSCSVQVNIENVSQTLADLLTNLGAFNSAFATQINAQLELVAGAVRELPITNVRKQDILNRIAQAQAIITSAASVGFITSTQVLAVLQILQLVNLKVQTLNLSCPQGFTLVMPSCAFNTSNQCNS